MFDSQPAADFKVGLFTDTLDEINGVARFIRDMSEEAARTHRSLIVHTCSASPRYHLPNRKNFAPVAAGRLPYYSELEMNLPPLSSIFEWVQRQRFDAIHISTPGMIGICGWLAATALDIPLLGTYHTDFPAYCDRLSGNRLLVGSAELYMRLFYRRMKTVFARSRQYQQSLIDLGLDPSRLTTILPCINTGKFSTAHRDLSVFERLGITQARRLLYCGRVSKEKNLSLLVEAFKLLCRMRSDTALIVAGEGPYLAEMKKLLAGLPVYFLGYQNDVQLGPLYAGCDLFVFPSRTDTLGQVVMEAQSSGLPVIVSDQGGPKEICADGVSGLVLSSETPADWSSAMDDLLNDEPRRLAFAAAAPGRIQRFSVGQTFDAFWDQHVRAAADRRRSQHNGHTGAAVNGIVAPSDAMFADLALLAQR